MTRTHSIDNLSENIKNPRSRDYFEEVVSSYYNGNYRSAIVMLYSVVICDLIYKLRELKDQYSDTNAKNILIEIEKIQKVNPTSPDWENKLMELVNSQTNIFEHSDYQNISHLQKHRHLCAHPVLLQDYNLYSPNRETVRAHIINILEGLLTKPALLSKKILDDFLQNLNDIKEILITEKDISIHLKSKYFDNLNFSIEKEIFRSLWKIIFKLNNLECNKNREINYKALKIILNRNYDKIIDLIDADKTYFSNNLNFEYFDLILSFLNQNPLIFSKLNESAKTLITSNINGDNNYKFKAWFINDSLPDHMKYITEIEDDQFSFSIKTESILELYIILKTQNYLPAGNELLISMFSKSANYNQADERFNNLIAPFLKVFDIHELSKIIEGIHNNGQISGRGYAKQTNYQIKLAVEKLDSSFDFSPFFDFRV